jgi:hypothetical protein
MVWGAAIVAVGGIVGSVISSSAAGDAADTAANAQNNATRENARLQREAAAQQQKNFDLLQTQEAPYRGIGTAAVDPFTKMLTGGYNMQESPSAKYAMQQGQKQINSALQTKGLEGNAVAQLGQLSSQVAANDYQTRFNNLLNALNVGTSAVAGTASSTASSNANLQSGANALTAANTAAAGNLSNIAMQNSGTQAGIIGAAAGQLGSIGSNIYGNWNNNNSSWTDWSGDTGGYAETRYPATAPWSTPTNPYTTMYS